MSAPKEIRHAMWAADKGLREIGTLVRNTWPDAPSARPPFRQERRRRLTEARRTLLELREQLRILTYALSQEIGALTVDHDDDLDAPGMCACGETVAACAVRRAERGQVSA